jgi:periplasmic protein TonB
MPTVPDFSSLIVSRRSSGAVPLARMRGLVLAGSLYASGLAALLLAPFVVLEEVRPPRAAEEPLVPLEFHQPRGGPHIRQGVRDGHHGPRPSSAAKPPQARAVPRPVDATPPPPESEIAESQSPIDGTDGPGDRLGVPGGSDDGPADGPDGNCRGCTGKGPGVPDGQDEPFDQLTPGLVPPFLVPGSRSLPEYPDLARRAGLQGTVILLVVVEADGRIGEIEVIKSPDQRWGFDLAAINAVKRWRYRPAMMNERPVAAYIQVMVEFTLAR